MNNLCKGYNQKSNLSLFMSVISELWLMWLRIFIAICLLLILCANFELKELKFWNEIAFTHCCFSWIILFLSNNSPVVSRVQLKQLNLWISWIVSKESLDFVAFMGSKWLTFQWVLGYYNKNICRYPWKKPKLNTVMCWIQASASKLFGIIIVVITDNSDQLTI